MTVFRRFLADRRRALLGWALGTALAVLMTVGFYPAVKDQPSLDEAMANLSDGMKAAFGVVEGVSLASPAGYLHGQLFATMLPVLLVILAVSLGARAIGSFEEEGHLELLLAHPVTRRRVAWQRLAGALVMVGGITTATAVLVLVLGAPFGALEGLPVAWVLAACAGCGTLAAFHGGIAFLVGCLTGRRGPALAISSAVAAAGYLVHGVLAGVDAPTALRYVSPWFWYLRTNMLVDGVDAVALLVPLVLTAVASIAGVRRFDHRDLR